MALPAFFHSTTALMMALFGMSLFAWGHRQKISRLSIDVHSARKGVNQSRNKMLLKVHEDAIVEKGSVTDARGNFSGNKNTYIYNAMAPPMHPESSSNSEKLTEIRDKIVRKLVDKHNDTRKHNAHGLMESTSCNKVAKWIWEAIVDNWYGQTKYKLREIQHSGPNVSGTLNNRKNSEGVYVVKILIPRRNANLGSYSHFAVIVNMMDERRSMYAFLMQAFGVTTPEGVTHSYTLDQWFQGNWDAEANADTRFNNWVPAEDLWDRVIESKWVPGFPERYRALEEADYMKYWVKLHGPGPLREDILTESEASSPNLFR